MSSSQIAVIYARVSSAKQVSDGNGLDSQATRRREYARLKGYDVVQTFSDDITGKRTTRPGMSALLSFLRQHRRDQPIVLIDDISRLARGLEAHLQLRTEIAEAGGKLESPTIEFGSDSDSQLVEHLLASVSQHQRQKNGEQTLNRMRARMMNGYWVNAAPVGYRYEKVAGHGKLLTPAPVVAPILKEALEGFASGRFSSQSEVRAFLERNPNYPCRLSNGKVHQTRVKELLTRVIYAGYVEHESWGVRRRKGHHEPLITLATFGKNQRRREGRTVAPSRMDLDQDFVLRGAVACADCGVPLRSAWSKGNTKRYAYYVCQTKACPSYAKSIPRDRIEGDFEALLKDLMPAAALVTVAKDMFRDAWEQRTVQADNLKKDIAKKLKALEVQSNKLLKRLMDTDTPAIISAYESKLAKLQDERLLLAEQEAISDVPQHRFEEQLELALTFLANPYKAWGKGSYTLRRTILKLVLTPPPQIP